MSSASARSMTPGSTRRAATISTACWRSIRPMREFYRGLLARYPRLDPSFSMDEVTIAESGDLAVVRGSYRVTMDRSQPDTVAVGKCVGVWIFTGGDWRLMINISNRDAEAGA